MRTGNSGKIIGSLIALAALATAAGLGLSFYFSSSTIHGLLSENEELTAALSNLTREEQVGFATVVSQTRDSLGQLTTELKFVQTAAGRPREIVDEQIFTIAGDVVHFDALIVKFSDEAVQDGDERALYLWRRIYGETTPPGSGAVIQSPGSAPERYHAITKTLRLEDRDLFWEAIWSLANDPNRLSEYGITAVFGNAIYTRLEPGKVYLFKISASGQIYPEVLDFGNAGERFPAP